MQWNKLSSSQKGKAWEEHAKEYLEKSGLKCLAKNYHCRFGEIDLIMVEQDTIVFVEVKFRQSKAFGGAISTISTKKQQKITKTAALYLQQQGLNAYNTSCRFDVVAIQGNNNIIQEINWLKNAF